MNITLRSPSWPRYFPFCGKDCVSGKLLDGEERLDLACRRSQIQLLAKIATRPAFLRRRTPGLFRISRHGCRGVEGILSSRVRREPFHITSWRRPRALGLRAFPKTFTVPAHGQPTRLFFYTDCGEGGDPSAGCRRLQPISSWRVTGCLSNLLRSQLWMGEGGY